MHGRTLNLLPDRGLLAVAAVVDVAMNARATPVSAKALSRRHGLLPRHLETLLQELVRADILKGTRGPRGGYELARERRRITVGEILRAAARLGDADSKPRSRPSFVDEVVRPALRGATDAFLAELDRTTVEDMCVQAEALGVERATGIDFTI